MIKVGTTFSGIGAPEQALKNLKISHVIKWACDNDKYCKQTYFANHTCEKWYDDIKTIDLDSLEYVDLYVFGFPCQDVSVFGKRDISQGRTALVEYSLNIIEKLRPKYILFENVKGLLSKKFEGFLNSIVQRLLVNYNLDYKVFNSRFWGVPQNRERVFCLGVRKDLQQIILPIQNKANITNIKSILEENVDDRYTISDSLYESRKQHRERNKEKGNGFGYRIIKDYSYTLLTTYHRLPLDFVYQENKNPRMLTEKEFARLQGYPDSFIIHKDSSQAYKQFGNTITVNVLEAIFNNLFNFVK